MELMGILDRLERVLEQRRPDPVVEESGVVRSLAQGVALVEGLEGVGADELVRFARGEQGLAFTLEPERVGVVLLDEGHGIEAGTRVRRTGRVVEVPVGPTLVGRVLDPLGRPLDGGPEVSRLERRAVEQPAPAIMERAPVEAPLQTGIKVIDALVPIGRGQRELIVGDRQTGKTSVAVDTILNQKDMICVYCSVGQRDTSVARVVAELERFGAMDYTLVVAAGAEQTPGLQFLAPFAATTMAEYFMREGRDALIVYDDLTRHARAYRQLSLLLRRPPGREAYPGDIFYLHSRLLERSTRLLEGGSLTALPIVETEAQNLAAYIPTNLISITDGQIVLSPTLFQKGLLPAVDVGRSVSRVGGDAQLPAYRAVTGDLRLSYAQFEELEAFARFDTRLSEATLRTLERGRRVRAVLRQGRYARLGVAAQLAVMVAVTSGHLDGVPEERVAQVEARLAALVAERAPELGDRVTRGLQLDLEEYRLIGQLAEEARG